MASIFFFISNYIVLEYLYNDEIISNASLEFKSIGDKYDLSLAMANGNSDIEKTGNVLEMSSVLLGDGREALLQGDTAYYYPNVDSNILVTPITFLNPLNIQFDKVRLHMLSGYNFDDCQGFVFCIYLRMNNDKPLKLCNIAFLKGETRLMYFNPRPKKFGGYIYDKYMEFKVPSTEYMLNQQVSNPMSHSNLSWYLTQGKFLSNQRTIYCSFSSVEGITTDNGLVYLSMGEAKRFGFNTTDQFDLLVAKIQESSDGDFFEYYAEWDGQLIEDFLYSLNSVAGNNYYVIHELRVFEQVGMSFTETDNFTKVQKDSYDDVLRYVPVLKFADTAVSFSIDYYVHLYNSTDGKSIYKSSTLTCSTPHKYGKTRMMLNVGQGITQPLKVYNKVVSRDNMTLQDNTSELIKTKILAVYVNNSKVDIKGNEEKTITIFPFDNIIKFDLIEKINAEKSIANVRMTRTVFADSTERPINLDSASYYYLSFVNNDGSYIRVEEMQDPAFNKSMGQLAFKVSKETVSKLQKLNNTSFYVTSKNPEGIETVIVEGTFNMRLKYATILK
jgi:hypothetical protein